MKLNKSKTKGKVHPSPSSSSSSSSSSSPFSLSSNSNDPMSSLNLLLPATILTLISTLSFQDREILAYMFTHSLKSSPINLNHHHDHKRKSKKSSPSFDCDCFDCYTAYWFRWDSSPCRELIHQAIEAFEEHLNTSEQPKKTTSCRKKDKERNTPVSEESPQSRESPVESVAGGKSAPEERERNKKTTRCRKKDKERNTGHRSSVSEESPEISPESRESPAESFAGGEMAAEERERNKKQQQLGEENKGLARKMLPDVIGLFNSRLWNLWGPNV